MLIYILYFSYFVQSIMLIRMKFQAEKLEKKCILFWEFPLALLTCREKNALNIQNLRGRKKDWQ